MRHQECRITVPKVGGGKLNGTNNNSRSKKICTFKNENRLPTKMSLNNCDSFRLLTESFSIKISDQITFWALWVLLSACYYSYSIICRLFIPIK